jgi:hypothetical protein
MPVVDDEKRSRKAWPLILGIGCGGCLLLTAIIVLVLWGPVREIYRGLGK